MAGILPNSASRLIETLFGDGSVTGMTDAQLLDRFVSQHDTAAERAFEVIVQRHGPMVMAVCRSSLGDLHEAEDVFQATFLVLARRAASLREPANLGPWLHGVARRTAQKAKARRARLERLIQQAGALTRIKIESQADWKHVDGEEDAEMLHEEIGRLPDKYRTPVVLCDLEGLSREEAARQLGWPMGTVGVRLMRARERLRARLTRRGMAPTGFATLPLIPRAEILAASLSAQTAQSALGFVSKSASTTGAISSHSTAIAVGVLRTMAIKKLTIGITAVLSCLLVAAGSFAVAFQATPKRPSAPRTAAPSQKASAKKDDSKSILTNGGFERADPEIHAPDAWKKGATVTGVQYLWDQTVAHQGRASLHLKKTAQRYFPIAQWTQEVKHQGKANRLKVVAFVKAQKTTKAILDVQFLDRGGEWSHQWVAYIGAKESSDPPVTHAWKKYEGVVAIPDGTEKIIIAPQIYGPGDIWFDDVSAEYTDAEPTDPTASNPPARSSKSPDPELADIADVPSEERKAGDDPRKRYFLIGPMAGSPPDKGYRLLVLLPGGDGSADFHPFARRIAKHALPTGYLVAQLVAVAWSPEQAKEIVWPTAKDRLAPVAFTTEEFVEAVIADVSRTKKVDPRFVFALGWSSGGPPTYATSLRPGTHLKGSFVAMSVFKPERYPSLENARSHGYYILHSPEDFIPISMAMAARDELRRAGARVALQSYEGGHGWRGDVYAQIRRGVRWLEANQSTPVGG